MNKTSYENCIDTGYINNITRGGRDVFQLAEERPYYFLSGKGFCFKGMRVAIDVENPALEPPPPMPNKAFTSSEMSYTNLLMLLATALAWTSI